MVYVDNRKKEDRIKALNDKVIKKINFASKNRGKVVDVVNIKV